MHVLIKCYNRMAGYGDVWGAVWQILALNCWAMLFDVLFTCFGEVVSVCVCVLLRVEVVCISKLLILC